MPRLGHDERAMPTSGSARADYHALRAPGRHRRGGRARAGEERVRPGRLRRGGRGIDFRDTFVRKLDKDIGPYWVLEICNPMLANRALLLDRTAGLLMPCKVAVWQDGNDAVVAALRPEVLTAITANEALRPIAREAERHIERALVRLEGVEPQPLPPDLA